MNAAAAQMFFAMLALLTNVATVALVAALLLRRRRVVRSALSMFASTALSLAFLVSLTATLGSLWFSESVGFTPCKLCWYQRIAIFPLPLFLGGMLLRRDLRAARYLVPATLVGSGISLWHWLVERVPSFSGKTSCAVDVPCSVPWFTEFGFVTLAWMALSTLTFVAAVILAGNVGTKFTEPLVVGEDGAQGPVEGIPTTSPTCGCTESGCREAGQWREVAESFLAACDFDEFGGLYDVHAGEIREAAERFRRVAGGDDAAAR